MLRQLIAYTVSAASILALTPMPAQSYGLSQRGSSSSSWGARGGGSRSQGPTQARSYGSHAGHSDVAAHGSNGRRSFGKSNAPLQLRANAGPGPQVTTPSGPAAPSSPASGGTVSSAGGTTPSAAASSHSSGARSSALAVATNPTTSSATPIQTQPAAGSQAQGASGLLLAPDSANSGAIPNSIVGAQVETATRGGKSRVGATGHTMPTCMAAWDAMTHITRARWRQICARTLVSPHI